MFAAAMLAAAAVTDNVQDVIKAALAEIPYSSRLYESVYGIINAYNSGVSKDECFNRIHSEYDEYTNYGWCHTIANAMVVTASLLYGEKDFAKSICMAVETGFDTDCNGATVGSVLGMILGVDAIDDVWKKPIGGECRTSIKGYPKINLADRVKVAMKHIAAKESK
jgi:ADP-ribosylglycohydrolase